MAAHDSLLDQLATLRLLETEELLAALDRAGQDEYRLMLNLVAEYPHKRTELGRLWADSLNMAYVNLETTIIDREAVARVPRGFCKQHKVIPLYQMDDVITLAAAMPNDLNLEDRLLNELGVNVSMVFSFPDEIADAIEISYQSEDALGDLMEKMHAVVTAHPEDVVTEEQLRAMAGHDFVIQFTKGIMLLAMNERASDIHIEPYVDHVRIRFRIDGVLQERLTLAKKLLPPVVSRLKILANADIAEQRLPQDGRIRLELRNRGVDMRFSVVPALHGEKVVLRILGSSGTRGVPDIDQLNFSVTVKEAIKQVSHAPNGVFFITGPTGSGKTTTLYSILKHINTVGINITTIEDPIEYTLPGANQVQVNETIHLDFANALRSFLRQDPDVILIGEIRDTASARIASQAAMTGHLVFATMHTNNALQAVSRLVDIGVEPFLVAPSLIAVMAQRLVRRICPHCKTMYKATFEEIDNSFIWDGKTDVWLYKGKGCAHCHGTGYSGRMGIHEIFIITKQVRELIAQNSSILSIEECARQAGFKSLRYDGLKKALRGLTTLAEIDRVTSYAEF
ncbi:MAG: type II/IV secretion system protein [Spartobacteria bacterium]|nr:type II/IV secretion system protein [Spartobacteria bacterium]